MRCPTRAEKLAPATRSRPGRRCIAADSVVSTTKGPGTAAVANAASVAMRAAEISGLGETRS